MRRSVRLSVCPMPLAQSTTVRFRATFTMEHQQETPCWKSNPLVSMAAWPLEGAETGTQPSRALFQKHSLDGRTIDTILFMCISQPVRLRLVQFGTEISNCCVGCGLAAFAWYSPSNCHQHIVLSPSGRHLLPLCLARSANLPKGLYILPAVISVFFIFF